MSATASLFAMKDASITSAASKIVRGRPFTEGHLAGGTGQWLLGGSDTGDGFALHHGSLDPGAGPPMHIHTREDQTFYVLAGEIEVTVGGERDILRAGDSVFLPRGIPHRLENLTSQSAELLLIIHPPGLERYFQELAQLPKPPPLEVVRSLSAQYGLSLVV